MKNIENIAEDLFNKIRSRFEPITMRDEKNKPTKIEREGRFFTFEFGTMDGKKHGMLTISIADESSIKITFTKRLQMNFSDPSHEQEWEMFLRMMRKFARRNMMNFDIRDITKSMLTKRDTDQIAAKKQKEEEDSRPIAEGVQWSGTTRTSIQDFGSARLLIRHSEAVNEEIPGSRSRKIQSMFIETDQGERFRVPMNRLSLGRALAQHLAHGGYMHDEAGQHIVNMAEEMNNLAFFVRNTRNRQFEDLETMSMVESAVNRYNELRGNLVAMGKMRNYHNFAETFVPEAPVQDEYDLDELKERFVKRMFDDRLTAALPYVYRAYQNRELSEQDRLVNEFDSWADSRINEGTWATPDDEDSVTELRKIMRRPIMAGIDGDDAASLLHDIIGSDELVESFLKASQGAEGGKTDVRPLIIEWLTQNNYERLAAEFREQLAQEFTRQTQPVQQEPAVPQSPQGQAVPQQQPAPPTESINSIKKLAGLQ